MAVRDARVVFIGAEEIGWQSLQALLDLHANVVGVYTLGAEMSGRAVAFRSFEPFQARGVRVRYGGGALGAEDFAAIADLKPDLIYEIGWSQLLPPDLLAIPSIGTVGMHGTLLPKHRGRAPIPWSIILGLTRTGMTLFHLTADADRGDIIGQEEFPIGPDDSAADVYAKAVRAASNLMVTFHPMLAAGTAPRRPQDLRRSDYWPRRTPQDGLIDWTMSTRGLYDWVRALTHPFPGAFTFWGERKLFIWRARPADGPAADPPGSVLECGRGGLLVAAGDGAVALESLQIEGEEELPGDAFGQRHHLAVGDLLG